MFLHDTSAHDDPSSYHVSLVTKGWVVLKISSGQCHTDRHSGSSIPPTPIHTHTHFVTGGIRMVEGKVRTTAMKNVPQYGNMMVLWRKHGHGKYPTVTSKSTISMGTERQQGSLLLLVCKISHFGQQVDNWHRNTCSLREQSRLVRKISHCDQQVNY